MLASRRALILRDSLTFLGLTLVTVALFTVTLFLFRSFAAHRTELGVRWSDRGRTALRAGHPEQAIDSLRTALSYTPGERSYELLLAQALAAAGHTEEAYNYFSGLGDAEPGDGFVNLQLARLAAVRHDRPEAINFYRASLYGTWEGDGVMRRREVRLELVRYLLQNREASVAHAELLVAEGNADNDPALDLEIGHLFEQIGDRTNALDAYSKAVEAEPGNTQALSTAGRLAYSMGEFATARRLLSRAARTLETQGIRGTQGTPGIQGIQETQGGSGEHVSHLLTGGSDLLANSERILEIFPSTKLSSDQRVDRLLKLKDLAKRRLDVCAGMPGGLPTALEPVGTQWMEAAKSQTRVALLRDQSRQDDLLQLIEETEVKAEALCGAATEDDALVVLLARAPKAVER